MSEKAQIHGCNSQDKSLPHPHHPKVSRDNHGFLGLHQIRTLLGRYPIYLLSESKTKGRFDCDLAKY
jgi:hypothetical protein